MAAAHGSSKLYSNCAASDAWPLPVEHTMYSNGANNVLVQPKMHAWPLPMGQITCTRCFRIAAARDALLTPLSLFIVAALVVLLPALQFYFYFLSHFWQNGSVEHATELISFHRYRRLPFPLRAFWVRHLFVHFVEVCLDCRILALA